MNKRPEKWGENQRLRVLFDSGCGGTLINKKFVRHWKKSRDKNTKWSTKAGSFKTTRRCEIEFTLPAFHANRNITCKAYVDESAFEDSHYDMIIGRDLLHSLGINLLFETGEISWDGAKIHMQPSSMLKREWIHEMEQEVLFTHDPTTTDAERIQHIIESKYSPASLKEIVEECAHLTQGEQQLLLKLLTKFEDLFDGTLGT